IINGEKETGITFMFMDEKVDAGDIIDQREIIILPDETYGELNKRLSNLSAEIINTFLKKIEDGTIKRITQESNLVTYAKKMSKEDGEIIWSNKGEKIYNLIRGNTPYPGAFTYYKERKLKITMARFLYNYQNELKLDFATAGEVVKIEKDGIFISTGDRGIIRILKVIPSGAKEMSAQQFVSGYKIKVGDILGE
ncbi:unnamed protein product, partial [marine sediment metagenome]